MVNYLALESVTTEPWYLLDLAHGYYRMWGAFEKVAQPLS